MLTPIAFSVSLLLALLMLNGLKEILKIEETRRALLYLSFLLASLSLLDLLGIYAVVPTAMFLAFYGAINYKKLSFERHYLYLLPVYALNFVGSRDSYTYYVPQAYFLVTHDPKYKVVELANSVASSLLAASSRPLVFSVELFRRGLLAFGYLSLVAIYEYFRADVDEKRLLLFLSVPYRSIEIAIHPDYIDFLLGLSVVHLFRSIYVGKRREARIALTIYGLAKQSRPLIVIPMLLIELGSLSSLVALLSFALLLRHPIRALYALPAFLIALGSIPKRRIISIDIIYASPLALLVIYNLYFFHRPLGSSARVIFPSSTLVETPIYLLLAGMFTLYAQSITPLRLGGFMSRAEELRPIALVFLLRSALYYPPTPRQRIAFRILVAIYLERKSAMVVAIFLSRLLAPFISLEASPEGVLLGILFFAFLFLLASRIKINKRLLYALALLSILSTVFVGQVYQREIGCNALVERVAEEISSKISGNLLVYLSPGYIESYLLPNVRLYEISRGFFLDAPLSEIEERLLELRIDGFFLGASRYEKAYEINERFLESLLPLAALIISDAFRYIKLSDGGLFVRSAYRDIYLVAYDLGEAISGSGFKINSINATVILLSKIDIKAVELNGERGSLVRSGEIYFLYFDDPRPGVLRVYTSLGIYSISLSPSERAYFIASSYSFTVILLFISGYFLARNAG